MIYIDLGHVHTYTFSKRFYIVLHLQGSGKQWPHYLKQYENAMKTYTCGRGLRWWMKMSEIYIIKFTSRLTAKQQSGTNWFFSIDFHYIGFPVWRIKDVFSKSTDFLTITMAQFLKWSLQHLSLIWLLLKWTKASEEMYFSATFSLIVQGNSWMVREGSWN